MKIVVLDGYTLNPGDLSWAALEGLGDVTVYERTSDDETAKRIGDAQYVYTNKTHISKETMDKCPNLKWIGVLATGYNIVDTDAAKAKNIYVSNVPDYSTSSVAQLVFALILELCHHAGDHSVAVKNGEWTNSKDFCFWNYPLIELKGKTLGIVGLGRIGQNVAKIAEAFQMNVLAYSRTRKTEIENDNLKYAELDELLKKSDIISLHCPLFESTKGMINKDSIKNMKDGVIIINTARGALIVEQDLKDALAAGKIAGAACDVVSQEPINADNPLLSAPNIILTPHIAWAPKEARVRLMNIAVNNLAEFLKGNPVNIVNM